jgi:hypothetical protein
MDGSAGRPTPLQRLREIEELGPGRVTGSALEKKAQEKLSAELELLGFKLEWRPHTWTRSIYSGLMVQFGLGVAGTGAVARCGVGRPTTLGSTFAGPGRSADARGGLSF